jgi:PKHD-type hydroxylase
MIWFEPPEQSISWDYHISKAFEEEDFKFMDDYVATHSDKLHIAETVGQGNGVDLSYRSSNILWMDDVEQAMPMYNKLIDIVSAVNNVHYKYSLSYIEMLQYSEYHAGDVGKYDVHCDSTLRNTSGFSRKISFSILLNDPSEFDGGQLKFHICKDPITATLEKKGDMVLFPSFLPHSVEPVTRGVRKSLVGWICGPNLV